MTLYLDASVLMRLVLEQPNSLPGMSDVDRGISSSLVTIECLRVIDRIRLLGTVSDSEIARRRAKALALTGSLELVEIDASVIERAARPMPVALRTLDAIHLATALLWREATGEALVMATHDRHLALGAQAHGLSVIGVP